MTEGLWYYMDRAGRRCGPANTAALAAALQDGQIDNDSLLWREGMAEWQPLAKVAPALGLSPAFPRLPPRIPTSTPSPDVVYAGFWRRYLALLLDQLILIVPLILLTLLLAFPLGLFDQKPEQSGGWFQVIYFLIYLLIGPVYYASQESSCHQATLGKRALGIKVTDINGDRLTFPHALGRWFAASLSYLTLYIGFLMAAFTERKQALHDVVAGTLVTDRWAYSQHPDRQKRGLSGCLVALVVGMAGGIPLLGILMAIAIPAYQDYTVRAKIAGAIATAEPLKQAVGSFHAEHGKCPANGEGTINAAGTYAAPYVTGIDTGSMENGGRCGIQITLRNVSAGVDGKHVWLEQDPATRAWQCSSDIQDRYLPAACRG